MTRFLLLALAAKAAMVSRILAILWSMTSSSMMTVPRSSAASGLDRTSSSMLVRAFLRVPPLPEASRPLSSSLTTLRFDEVDETDVAGAGMARRPLGFVDSSVVDPRAFRTVIHSEMSLKCGMKDRTYWSWNKLGGVWHTGHRQVRQVRRKLRLLLHKSRIGHLQQPGRLCAII